MNYRLPKAKFNKQRTKNYIISSKNLATICICVYICRGKYDLNSAKTWHSTEANVRGDFRLIPIFVAHNATMSAYRGILYNWLIAWVNEWMNECSHWSPRPSLVHTSNSFGVSPASMSASSLACSSAVTSVIHCDTSTIWLSRFCAVSTASVKHVVLCLAYKENHVI